MFPLWRSRNSVSYSSDTFLYFAQNRDRLSFPLGSAISESCKVTRISCRIFILGPDHCSQRLGRVVSAPHSLVRGSGYQRLETGLCYLFVISFQRSLITILGHYVHCQLEMLGFFRTIYVLRFVVTPG